VLELLVIDRSGELENRLREALAPEQAHLIPISTWPPVDAPSGPLPDCVVVAGDAETPVLHRDDGEPVPIIRIGGVRGGGEHLPPEFGRDELLDLLGRITSGRAAVKRLEVAPGFIARSRVMREVLHEVSLYTDCDANVLVLGETGTGKESIARALHEGHARRRAGPFVSVNCGAVPDGLFESEFFGHSRGAFTGAVGEHAGYFEQATGGTLFLDEIGELPLHQQVKLLRVLEQRRVTPLGSRRSVELDFRLVSATNRDLHTLVEAGQFRADLFYRLAVVVLRLPGLEERGTEDKLAIFEAVLNRVALRHGYRVGPIPEWVCDEVIRTRFQGNVRELINLAERIAITYRAGGGWNRQRIGELFSCHRPQVVDRVPGSLSGRGESERRRILEQLEAHHWHRKATAAALGISRKVLWEKMRKYRLYEHPGLRGGGQRRGGQ
jgi:DNA-binding NtrC family response regulator